MCEAKHWNSLLAREAFNNSILVIAKRSDGVLVDKLISFQDGLKAILNVDIVKRAINELESYRNCKCTQTSFCELHAPINYTVNKTNKGIEKNGND